MQGSGSVCQSLLQYEQINIQICKELWNDKKFFTRSFLFPKQSLTSPAPHGRIPYNNCKSQLKGIVITIFIILLLFHETFFFTSHQPSFLAWLEKDNSYGRSSYHVLEILHVARPGKQTKYLHRY